MAMRAGTRMAKAELTTVQAGAKAVLKAVARLHPDEALEVLEPISAEETQGIRRRVLLAARIGLMRKALAAPARVIAAPVVEVVAEVVEPPPAPPPPEPKPLPKGRIMSINLDDLASMLSEPPEPEGTPPAGAVAATEEAAAFTALDWGEVAGTLDAAGTDPLIEAAEPDIATDTAAPVKAARGKKRGAVVAIKDGTDGAATLAAAGALFAAIEEDGGSEPAAAPVAVADAAALFAAMEDEAADVEPAPAQAAMVDMAAAFAAMEEAEVVEVVPAEAEERAAKAAPVPVADAAALFAAMEDDAPDVGAAPAQAVVDMAAAFAAMEEAEVVEVIPAEAEERAAKAAPVPVADAAALFAAMEDDAPEVSLAKPAEVDVAAAFAALGGEAEDAPSPALAVDPAAAFAALEDAGLAETQAISVPARPPVVDAGAAFAALDAAEEEEARALAPAPGKKAKPLAVDLSAQFAAMDDE